MCCTYKSPFSRAKSRAPGTPIIPPTDWPNTLMVVSGQAYVEECLFLTAFVHIIEASAQFLELFPGSTLFLSHTIEIGMIVLIRIFFRDYLALTSG